MGIRDILAKLTGRNEEKSRKYKELEEDFLLRKKLEERQKSANERELERFMKEKREERIKTELQAFRDKQKHETWSSNTMLNKGASILKNDRPILKEPDVIRIMKSHDSMKGNMLNGGEHMFFRW